MYLKYQLKHKLNFILVFPLLIFLPFGCCKKYISSINIKLEGIQILQGKKQFSIIGNSREFTLDKKEFYLDFEILPTQELRVVTVFEEEDLEYLKEGKIEESSPFFGARRHAGDPFYDNTLYITHRGNQSFFYDKQLPQIREYIVSKDNKVRLRFLIKYFQFHSASTNMKISNINLNKLYIMFFIDEDFDNYIDEGEYHIAKINFK